MSEPPMPLAEAETAGACTILATHFAASAAIADAPDLPSVTAVFEPAPSLAEQLLVANAKVAELTQANTELTDALGEAERMLKRVRRNARNSDSSMQDKINVLQNRRF